MDSAKQQLVEKLKDAKNVLVTVSRNPDVDQLSSLIGLALLLNKQGKHCAAVFSGQVPSTLEFLSPEETIEKNTDSLRDFIIALDKSKADKLRYKVEDDIVRIFITPYRTSINQDDLDFSQGDFNVDVVVALGVHDQADLDDVITAHGRILHDAVVASINIADGENGLGSIDWHDSSASSLSELVTGLAQSLGDNLLDEQIATALLTGIVSETERFSNDKTTPNTMSISAALMAAGANQQLVATKLEEPVVPPGQQVGADQPAATHEAEIDDDGTLKINHLQSEDEAAEGEDREHMPEETGPEPPFLQQQPDIDKTAPPSIELPEVHDLHQQESEVDAISVLKDDIDGAGKDQPESKVETTPGNKLITEPPTLGGTLTSNAFNNPYEPSTDPFSMPTEEPPQLFERGSSSDTAPPADDLPAVPASLSTPGAGGNSDLPAQLFEDDAKNPGTDLASSVQPGLIADTTNLSPGWTAPPSPVDQAASLPSEQQLTGTDEQTLSHIEQAVDSPHVYQSDKSKLSNLEQAVHSPHLFQSDKSTLSNLEEAVHSPHLEEASAQSQADSAREEIDRALGPTGQQPSSQTGELSPSLNTAMDPTDNGSPLPNGQTPPPVAPPLPFNFGE